MIADLVASILDVMVIEPFRAALADRLAGIGGASALLERAETCLTVAVPELAARAANDWWWTLETVVRVAFGLESPENVIASASAECSAIVNELVTLEQAQSI